MLPEILPFDSSLHREPTVVCLSRLRTTGNDYPPASDCGDTPAELDSWLFRDPVIKRWVALSDAGVLGHVCVGEAHDYLALRLETRRTTRRRLLEVGKLFVSPDAQSTGLGRRLLATALEWTAADSFSTALAVLPTSEAAVQLYRSQGLTEVGRFEGIHGTNLVFVDDAALEFHERRR